MRRIFKFISPSIKKHNPISLSAILSFILYYKLFYIKDISRKIIKINRSWLFTKIISLAFIFTIIFTTPFNLLARDSVKIGVLSTTQIDKWCAKLQPTADYLTNNIDGHIFTVVPLKFEEMDKAIKNKKIDFVFLNSSMYVKYEQYYGISRIATLKNKGLCDSSYSRFAGIVFCKADRKDINNLNNLKGKSLASVHKESFGGFQMAWREFDDIGINPFDDFKSLTFTGTHDGVIFIVLNGLVDAGTVRADIFSDMSKAGLFDSNRFKILNQQSEKNTKLHFPCSTRPYPEWPIAKLNHVSFHLSEKVAIALLEMSPDSFAAVSAEYAGWTIPYNYQSVHECLKQIKAAPYESLGKFSFTDVLDHYLIEIILGTILFLFLIFATLKIASLNTSLSKTRKELELALSETNAFNLVLFKKSQIPILIIDPDDSNCLDCNDACLRFSGFDSKDQLLNHNFLDCSADVQNGDVPSLKLFTEKINAVLKQGSMLFEWKGKKLSGEIWEANIHIASFKHMGKTLLQCSIMEITEQKKKEKKLAESKRKLDEAQRIAHIGSWELDLITNKLTWSDEIYRIFEINPDEFGASYEAFLNLIHPDDREKVNQAYKDSVKNRKPYKITHRLIFRDNRIKWVVENCETYYDKFGVPLRSVGTVQDITEQIEVANKLREAHQLLETVFDNTHIMIAYFDSRFRFIRVNNAYAKADNKEPSYFPGKNHFDLYPNEENEEIFRKVVETGEPYFVFAKPFTYANFKKRGETYWDWSLIPIKNSDGEVDGLILSLLNVTERVKAETALKQSEQKFKNLINYSPIGIYQSGLDGEIIFANNRFAQMLGYNSPEELTNLNIEKDIYVDPLTRYSLIDQFKKGEIKSEIELSWKKKNGEIIWIRNSARVNRDINGNILSFEGFVQDINLWKKYETELIKLSKAVEQSSAAIIITGPDGNIEYVNKSFTTITGYNFEEVKNKNPRILKSGKQNNEFYNNMWQTILSGKDWQGEIQNKRKNGELYWERSIITPIINEKGKIINFVALKEDITEKKKMIKDLIDAKEKAEEMNRIKSVFFANMSHELRTPFVGIMGYAELLSETLTDPEAKEMADGILNTSIRLTDTLTKILDITQLEYKKIEAVKSIINIENVIDEIYIRYNKAAKRKNLRITKSIDLDNNFIETDANLLSGILSNLVSNSIKYTDKGWVKIAAFKKIDGETNKLIIKVADSGIGIPDDKKELIWEEFRQGSEGTTRNYQGCGLGLSIAQKYTELIGGKIYLESEYGSGSTFTIEIPID